MRAQFSKTSVFIAAAGALLLSGCQTLSDSDRQLLEDTQAAAEQAQRSADRAADAARRLEAMGDDVQDAADRATAAANRAEDAAEAAERIQAEMTRQFNEAARKP